MREKRPSSYVLADDPIDRERARLCQECVFAKCRDCYDTRYDEAKQIMFKHALELGVPETLARRMFRGGDKL